MKEKPHYHSTGDGDGNDGEYLGASGTARGPAACWERPL